MGSRRTTAGTTLLELLLALTLIGLLTGLAAPSLGEAVDAVRVRGTLDRLAAELQYARLLAVREGQVVDVVPLRDSRRCVIAYSIQSRAPAVPVKRVEVDARICLRSNRSGPLSFDPRGLSRGTWQTFSIEHRERSHAVIVSSAGRVRRDY